MSEPRRSELPTSERLCATCGSAFQGKARAKFCSGKCRKAQYATPCVDCGASTSGSEGRRPDTRCSKCANAHLLRVKAEKYEAKSQHVITLYNAGMPLKTMAAETGLNDAGLHSLIIRLRAAGRIGYRQAITPEGIEKKRAGGYRSAELRAKAA